MRSGRRREGSDAEFDVVTTAVPEVRGGRRPGASDHPGADGGQGAPKGGRGEDRVTDDDAARPSRRLLRTAATRARLLQLAGGVRERHRPQVAVYRSYFAWGETVLTPLNKRLLKRATPPRPYISIHAFLDSKGRNPLSWADVANGVYDADIDKRAAELLSITAKTPVYLCFHHEMENEESKCGTPDEFQAAYWHFRDRIENVNGVPKLTWVVTYMGDTVRGKHGGPERWWPGSPPAGLVADQLMGIDLYNRNVCHSKKWREFDYLAAPRISSRPRSGARCSSGNAAPSRPPIVAARRTIRPEA